MSGPRCGGRGRRDAVVDHVRVAEAQVLGDDDDLVGGARRAAGRRAPGPGSAAPWCVASTGGRRGPRPRRAAAAAITVAFVLWAWIDVRAEGAHERRLARGPLGDAERRAPALGQDEAACAQFGVERARGARDRDLVAARGQAVRERHHDAFGASEGHARAREQDPHGPERYRPHVACRPLEQWPARLDRSPFWLSSWPRWSPPSRTPRRAP